MAAGNNQKPLTRKQLFRNWSQERKDAYLAAESAGVLQEVPGGWVINDHFYDKLPFLGAETDALTSYLQFLVIKGDI